MSSSSSKKKHQAAQCRACGCHCLPKDMDKHAGTSTSTSSSTSTIAAATPKQSLQQQRRRTGKMTPGKEENPANCTGHGFMASEVPLVEPAKGAALRVELLGANELEAMDKWEQSFSVELMGWQRRHSALVNPELFGLLGALPRSAVLVEQAGEGKAPELLVLWPCEEIPLFRIALPPWKRKPTVPSKPEAQQLLRLRLIPKCAPPLTNLLLRPNPSESELPLGCWSKLEKLGHFPYFLRSYFANALVCLGFPLEVFYYGQQLQFEVLHIEGQQPTTSSCTPAGIEREMQKCSLGSEDAEETQQVPAVHRISPLCKFAIDWSQIPMDVEEGNEDPDESLL